MLTRVHCAIGFVPKFTVGWGVGCSGAMARATGRGGGKENDRRSFDESGRVGTRGISAKDILPPTRRNATQHEGSCFPNPNEDTSGLVAYFQLRKGVPPFVPKKPRPDVLTVLASWSRHPLRAPVPWSLVTRTSVGHS